MECCRKCIFYREDESAKGTSHKKKEGCTGRCHRRIAPVDGHVFAAVYKDDWCGDYKYELYH